MKNICRQWWHLKDSVMEFWADESEWVGLGLWIIASLIGFSLLWICVDAAEGILR